MSAFQIKREAALEGHALANGTSPKPEYISILRHTYNIALDEY
jgi:hypothetical protein